MVTNPLKSLFGHSPFKPLQQHMRVVVDCAAQVPGLYQALFANDDAGVQEARDRIFSLEQEADDIKNTVRAHLPKSLLMPVNRADLLDLLGVQDDIAGSAQDVAGFLMTRKMAVIEPLKEPMITLTERCSDTCAKAGEIVGLLDELIETGFVGRESNSVGDLVEELSKIESETDVMAVETSKALFANEDKMGPVDVMFWFELIKWTANMADNAEHVGNRLRLMIAR